MKEYREITDPIELFQLKAQGAEIEVQVGDDFWTVWGGGSWNGFFRYRLVTEVTPKKVKVLAYRHVNGEVRFVLEDSSADHSYDVMKAERIPQLDMEYEE